MSGTIELRAFMGLGEIFKERDWPSPLSFQLTKDKLEGRELLSLLDIPEEKVEVIFINGKACSPAKAMIKDGDRVALVPPGTPGPYRVLLGFIDKGKS